MEVLKIVDWGWVMCWRVKVVLDILYYGVWSFIKSFCNFLSTEKCIYELWTCTQILFWGKRNLPLFYYSVLQIWICFLGFLSTIKAVGFLGLFAFLGFHCIFGSVFCSRLLQWVLWSLGNWFSRYFEKAFRKISLMKPSFWTNTKAKSTV